MATVKNFINNKDETVQFKIEFVGKKDCPFWDASSTQHNKVTMRNLATRKSATIDFWGSKMKPNQDSVEGLKGALDCITLDISSVECSDFEAFCAEMCYDTDSRKAEKIYNACKKELDKFERVVGDLLVMDNIRNWIDE